MIPHHKFKTPPKPNQFHDRQHFKREVFVGKTEDIKRKPESPIKGEHRPAYHIDFHCRERRGKCWLSYTMNLSAVELGVIISKFILDAHTKYNYDPRRMAQAIVKCVNEGMDAYEKELKELQQKEDNQ